MRIDYQAAKKKCLKCPRYSEKAEFGKCMATKSDMIRCAYEEWFRMCEGVKEDDRKNQR